MVIDLEQRAELDALGFGPFFSDQLPLLESSGLRLARVIGQEEFGYQLGGGAKHGRLSGRLINAPSPMDRPVVGDWVGVRGPADRTIIDHVLDRHSGLPIGAEQTRLAAANVDMCFIVTSAREPLDERRVERYLDAVWAAGSRPVVLLNQVDSQPGGSGELRTTVDSMVRTLESLGFGLAVLKVSAHTGEGLDELQRSISPEATVALIGSPAVGKSSLAKQLAGGQSTLGKGSPGRQLWRLPGGGLLIDTPALREFSAAEQHAAEQTLVRAPEPTRSRQRWKAVKPTRLSGKSPPHRTG